MSVMTVLPGHYFPRFDEFYTIPPQKIRLGCRPAASCIVRGRAVCVGFLHDGEMSGTAVILWAPEVLTLADPSAAAGQRQR